MPCRPSPRSLRQASLDAVARNFESICYGAARGTKELHRLIETDAITQYDSPFGEWPSSLLADLSDAIYRVVESHFFLQKYKLQSLLELLVSMPIHPFPKKLTNFGTIL